MSIFPYDEAMSISHANATLKEKTLQEQTEAFHKERMDFINKAIKASASEGKYNVYLDGHTRRLQEFVVNKLLEAGYTVVYYEHSEGRDRYCWTYIYWGEEADKIRKKWWYKLGFYRTR